MRDLNLVSGCKFSLDSIGCDYKLMSMVPFDSKQSDGSKMSNIDYLLKFYNDILTTLEPNVLDTVFDGDWNTRSPRPAYQVHWQKQDYVDNHPTPSEHLEYLQKIMPNVVFSKETLEFVTEVNQQVLSKDFTMTTFKQHSTHRLGVDYE
jgi:hypothetical protein